MPVSPAAGAGTLLTAEEVAARVLPGIRLPARAWRITHTSATADGAPRHVSGLVLLPRGPRRDRALVGVAPATRGTGPAAAPSRTLPRGLDPEASSIGALLARGWGVAVTDYEGIGLPGTHPYMVGRTVGRNVLDVMRAARALHPEDLPADAPAAVVGYSAGAHAAGWAAQLQPIYAPEIPLAAVACGAVPADPAQTTAALEGSIFGVFVGYALLGYAAAYPELDLDGIATDRGRRILDGLRSRSLPRAMLHPTRVRLTDPSVTALPAWQRRFAENRLGALTPTAPVLLHHSPVDRLVRFSQAAALADRWRATGATVSLRRLPAPDHGTGGLVGTFVATRFLGELLHA